jgi:hypothetical protein
MRHRRVHLRLGWLALVVLFLATAVILGSCDDTDEQGGGTVSQLSYPLEGTVWVWDVPVPSPTPRSYMCDW